MRITEKDSSYFRNLCLASEDFYQENDEFEDKYIDYLIKRYRHPHFHYLGSGASCKVYTDEEKVFKFYNSRVNIKQFFPIHGKPTTSIIKPHIIYTNKSKTKAIVIQDRKTTLEEYFSEKDRNIYDNMYWFNETLSSYVERFYQQNKHKNFLELFQEKFVSLTDKEKSQLLYQHTFDNDVYLEKRIYKFTIGKPHLFIDKINRLDCEISSNDFIDFYQRLLKDVYKTGLKIAFIEMSFCNTCIDETSNKIYTFDISH